jgi:NADH:ubiquinone oxidoreductase subunit 3 (subunit A)
MDMSLFIPPLAFPIVLIAVGVLSLGLSRLRTRGKIRTGGAVEPYACGEDVADKAMIQPDYGQFLPFAFFFTILHVIALMATTVPVATMSSFIIAIIYVLCAIVGLFVLYSR